MGYQALLFCPEEKIARTVTQVLSELEFAVEACSEPFAAVKKLMGEHFDAIVVDCDNEQNATLLFKSARNSTSNQASLAVAVVEGQAGVAKAFRIGANLVLTKPINVEQAKGTLRVARGLLRKGEPGKPATAPPVPTAAAAPAASPAKPAAPKPPAPVQTAAPTLEAARKRAMPVVTKPVAPVIPPAPPQIQAPVASIAPKAKQEDVLEIGVEEKVAAVLPTTPAPLPPTPKAPPIHEAVSETRPVVKLAAPTATTSSGAASAPAPAREPQPAKIAETVSSKKEAPESFEKPVEPSQVELASIPAPTFTFGGANVEESTGGNKKVFIGVAAALVLAVAGYFVWSHVQSGSEHNSTTASGTAISQPVQPAPSAPSPSTHTPAVASPAAQPAARIAEPVHSPTGDTTADDSIDEKNPVSPNAKSAKATATTPEEAPLMVKGGSAPAVHKTAPAADAAAPSVIGMGALTSAAPPLDLATGSESTPRPVLQALHISQGVSRGLLIKQVQPSYPQNAMSMRIEGAVNLLATISKSGNITSVKVLDGPPMLTPAAVSAVRQWKYKPYLLNGEPVEIQTQITVNFKLPH